MELTASQYFEKPERPEKAKPLRKEDLGSALKSETVEEKTAQLSL